MVHLNYECNGNMLVTGSNWDLDWGEQRDRWSGEEQSSWEMKILAAVVMAYLEME